MRWLQGWWPSIAWDGIATSWDLAEGTPPLISTWWRAGLGFFWAQKKLGIIQDLWEFRVIFWEFMGIYWNLWQSERRNMRLQQLKQLDFTVLFLFCKPWKSEEGNPLFSSVMEPLCMCCLQRSNRVASHWPNKAGPTSGWVSLIRWYPVI